MTSLENIKNHRDALLLAEVGAWLHDMGKSTDIFINEKDAKGFKFQESTQKKPVHLNPHKAIFTPDELSSYTFSEDRLPERIEEASHATALVNTLDKNVKNELQNSSIELSSEQCFTLSELIYFSRPGMVGRTANPLRKKHFSILFVTFWANATL